MAQAATDDDKDAQHTGGTAKGAAVGALAGHEVGSGYAAAGAATGAAIGHTCSVIIAPFTLTTIWPVQSKRGVSALRWRCRRADIGTSVVCHDSDQQIVVVGDFGFLVD